MCRTPLGSALGEIKAGIRLLISGILCLGAVTGSRADVRINEFVAENASGLQTAAGKTSDWIELYNDATNAVDISGWYLTDKLSSPTKWRIPDGTSIASNGYRVVFADSSAVSVTNGELHANFSLSQDGEYLGLYRPDGATVADAYAPTFPQQYGDVSYGHTPHEYSLIGSSTPVRFRIPNSSGTAAWTNAVGALGFGDTNGAFTVRYYEMNTGIGDIDTAEYAVAHSSYWKTDRTYPIVGQHATINFHANGSNGYFGNDELFPGHSYSGEDRDNFVVVSEGAVYIPQAGQWTFAVGSDDGFRLRIEGHGVSFVTEYPWGRGMSTSLATFTFPVAGIYNLSLIFFENGGAASEEFSVAQGFQSDFSSSAFSLVGDPASGVIHEGAIGALVETDLSSAMRGVNTRVDAEWSFTLSETPATNDTVTLDVRCADGFTASLNGTPLAALNAPTPLLWNSAATAERSLEAALQTLSFAVPVALLTLGTNTLAVTALNNTASDANFLIQPRLAWRTSARYSNYFKTPTPGSANGQGYTAPTPKITVSEPRGYKTGPFTVSLSCSNAPAAVIRYTTDGCTPSSNSPCYTSPISITNTTVLRAAVIDPDSLEMNVKTVTWLFLDDVLSQGATPPAGWPANGAVNGQALAYGMRSQIVTGDPVRLRNGFTNAIATLSLVTDLTNLFDATSGIYVNPYNDGITWERPVSVEQIDPVHGSTNEFHIDAGLRIRGAFSRTTGNPKHSFRLFFRPEYGEDTLKFKLFGDEGASTFDKVDLRTSQNYSWAYENSDNETFVRETFSRDSQRDMGMPYTRSRYYHLFINGQYWGLYQTQERGDADFAETYLGGDNADWDCIKTSQPGYSTTASDGTADAFYALHDIAINQGFSGDYSNNYWRVRGLNPNGTVNTNYPAYLDQDNLIDYMLVAYYTGDPDSPVSAWGGFPNNMYALFNRANPSGFKWLRHDAEHSLGANGSYGVDCDTTYVGSDFTDQARFNPATLHQRLCLHPEYRMRFADLVRKHLYGDGALTPTNAQLRFSSRMKEIDTAIVAESARWGNGKTRDDNWLPACNTVLNTYLSQRRDMIVNHFRNHGWYPWLECPSFSANNTAVPSGYALRVSATNVFYYTTNGTDPRLPGGGISPNAVAVTQHVAQAVAQPTVLVARGAVWRYFDLGYRPAAANGDSWIAPTYPDTSWQQGPAVLGVAGGATANTVATTTRRYVTGTSGTQVTTTYFRRTFTLTSTNGVTGITLELLRDDGCVVYLNGTELLRENMSEGEVSYDTWSSSGVGSPDQNTYFTRSVSAALLRPGTNTLAVEMHQCNSSSSDLYFDLSATTTVGAQQQAPYQIDVPVTNALNVLTRTLDGSNWSPLAEAHLTVSRQPDAYATLRVSELMYAPPSPASGSPYVNDDFAWLELRNTGKATLNLAGIHFASGIVHTFGDQTLAPGGRLVLAKNPAAFSTRYATNAVALVAWTSGNLARKGEALSLVDPDGTNILTFTYSNAWYPSTYNTGLSLVAVDLSASEPLWSTQANWRPSHTAFGSPGKPDAPRFSAAALHANEHAMVLSAEGLEDSASLWFSEDLRNWVPCDSRAWSSSNGTFAIDLQSPYLPATSHGFFQLRTGE